MGCALGELVEAADGPFDAQGAADECQEPCHEAAFEFFVGCSGDVGDLILGDDGFGDWRGGAVEEGWHADIVIAAGATGDLAEQRVVALWLFDFHVGEANPDIPRQ